MVELPVVCMQAEASICHTNVQNVRQSRRVNLPLASGSPAAECPLEDVVWGLSAETSGTDEAKVRQ